MKYVKYNDDGNILSYGVTAKEGIARKRAAGENVLAVDKLERDMDINFKVKKGASINDDILEVKKKGGS